MKYYADGMLFLKNGNIVKLGKAEFVDPECSYIKSLPNGWAKLLTFTDGIPHVDLALQEQSPNGMVTISEEVYMILKDDMAVEKYVGENKELKGMF